MKILDWLRGKPKEESPDAWGQMLIEWQNYWKFLIDDMPVPPPLTGDPDTDYTQVHRW